MSSIAIGHALEDTAVAYLQKHKVQVLHRNFRCKYGEVDLIGRDQEDLIFVEVRYRKDATFGAAAETVTADKQRRIICAAQFFLMTRSWATKLYCRFDVIAITKAINSPTIEWIKDAFNA